MQGHHPPPMPNWQRNYLPPHTVNQPVITPLQSLVFAEQKFLTSLRSLSAHAGEVADASRRWIEERREGDLEEATNALTHLFTAYASALEQQVSRDREIHVELDAIRAREDAILQREEQSRQLSSKAESTLRFLQNLHPKDPRRSGVVQQLDDLYIQIATMESLLDGEKADVKAQGKSVMIKWFSSKIANISECSERASIVGSYGQRIISTVLDETERVQRSFGSHQGRSSVDTLLGEAFHRLKDANRLTHIQPIKPIPVPLLPNSRPATPLRLDTGIRPQLAFPQPSLPNRTSTYPPLASHTPERANPMFWHVQPAPPSDLGLNNSRQGYAPPVPPRPLQSATDISTPATGSSESRSPFFSTLSPSAYPNPIPNRRLSTATSPEQRSATDDLLSPFLPIIGRGPDATEQPHTPRTPDHYFAQQAVAPTPSAESSRHDAPAGPSAGVPLSTHEDVIQPSPEPAKELVPERQPEAESVDVPVPVIVEPTSAIVSTDSPASDGVNANPEAPPSVQSIASVPEVTVSGTTQAGAATSPSPSTGLGSLPTPRSGVIASMEHNVLTAGKNLNLSTAGRDVYVYNGVENVGKEELDFLNWISPVDSKAVQSSILEKITPGTGSWFLASEIYQGWKTSTKVLWGAGKPGAGKTCLSSIVIKSLLENAGTSETVIYVHCRYAERYTTTQVFAAFLRQLVENSPTVSADVKDKLYTPYTRQGRARVLALPEITKAILTGIGAFSKTYIVLDALDELEFQVRHDIVGILQKEFKVATFVTSRMTDLPDGRVPDFEIRAPPADFHAFVQYQIDGCARLKAALAGRADGANIITEAAEKVEELSDGLFLMAALQVATLKDAVTVKALREAVDRLPQKSIDEMYQSILERVQYQSEEMKLLAFRVIGWVVYSIRPLQLRELIDALAIKPGSEHVDWEDELVQPDILIATCCGLLTFERQTHSLRFIHVTAHHFFEARKDSLEAVFTGSPHYHLAEICATYMKVVLGGQRLAQDALRAMFCSRVFLDHACRYVGAYIGLAMDNPEDGTPPGEDIEPLVLQYTPEPLRQLASIPLLTGINNGTIDQGSLAHLAALNGLTLLLIWKASSYNRGRPTISHINETSEEGLTPLFYAGIGGHIPCLKRLLEERDIDVHHKAKNGYTALITTGVYDQKKAQQILLVDHRAREHARI